MTSQRTRPVLLTLVALSTLWAAGCDDPDPSSGGSSGLFEFPTPSIAEVIVGAGVLNGPAGVMRSGPLPSTTGGPSLTLNGNLQAIPGGSVQITTSATPSMDTLVVSLAGFTDYWEFPVAQTVPPTEGTLAGFAPVTVVFNVSQTALASVSGNLLRLVLRGGLQGAFGPATTHDVALTSVGTGILQVSLSFDSPSDIDLHVVEPGGNEIYYGNPTSATSGVLDLDSNAACFIDGVNNENINWPAPPSGEYVVRVDNWDSCAAEPIAWVVTVNVQGEPPQTFTGNFNDAGDQGGAGSGVTVATFAYPTE